MKKVSSDELRPEYQRSDLGKIVRGKYAKRMAIASNVIVLRPEVAHAFPNDDAVNDALSSLIELARKSTQDSSKSVRTRNK